MVVDRFDIYLVTLDPTIGSEIRKKRPCVIISPNEINHNIATVIIAPMTTKTRPYPSRVPCKFDGRQGQIVLDQLRTVCKRRLVRKLGTLDRPIRKVVLERLALMFAE